MNRKDFLQTTIPLVASVGTMGFTGRDENKSAIPKYLKEGDTIGITCPSGWITIEEVQACIKQLEAWGFKVVMDNTVGAKDSTFAGTDDERAAGFQKMMDDESIDAIMLGRGGYGAIRIIDKIDFSKFRKKPKWVMGFSDATIVHLQLARFGIPSIHCKMCNSFPDDPSTETTEQAYAINSINTCLRGEQTEYDANTTQVNRPGSAKGKLIGGNLSIIGMMCGSKSAIRTDGCILFIEDVEEYMYKIDGMLWNLLRSGKLDRLKGLIIGQFRIKPDDPGEEFGLTLHDIVMEKVNQFSYPVCFDFPVGHVYANNALKCGMPYLLQVSPDNSRLTSLA